MSRGELLQPGQRVVVVDAPAWPFLVGVTTTIREVVERSILGGPAYLLRLYAHDGAPFLAKHDEVRAVETNEIPTR